jgi:hypothetical protein
MNSKALRLVLTPEQSAAIHESGIRFAVVHPGSYPTNPGRWVVDLIECDQPTADAAVSVAQGRATARMLKSKIDFRHQDPTDEA